MALIQESLNVATPTCAARPSDYSKLIADTIVQPKAVAFPMDAKLVHSARERLVRLAAAAGYNFRRLLAWLGGLWRVPFIVWLA